MNKKYFSYLFQSKRNIGIFLLIVNLIFPTLMYFISFSTNELPATLAEGNIYWSGIILLIECYILPVIYLYFIQNKRSVDTYFALPISRKDIYITTYLYTVLQIVLLHLIAITPILLSQFTNVKIIYVLIYLLVLTFVVMAVVLAVFAIIFRANSLFDAIALLALYTLLPLFFEMTLETFCYDALYGVNRWSLFDFGYMFLPIIFMQSFQKFILDFFIKSVTRNLTSFIYLNYKYCLLLIGIIGLVALVLCLNSIKTRKAEDAEQISNNLLSYPLLIALITFSLVLTVVIANDTISQTFIYLAMIFVGYLVMTFIYRRKIAITKRSVILFATSILLSFGFQYASNQTNGFGLSYLYQKQSTITDISGSFEINADDVSYSVYFNDKNVHSDYTDADFVNFIKARQDYYVDKHYSELNTNNSVPYENRLYSSIYVHYDKGAYSYGDTKYFNKENIEEMFEFIEELEKYNCVNFEVSTYNHKTGYSYEEITMEEFKATLNEYFGV